MVRDRAREFRVLPDEIGVLGFSAGGHLASTAEMHFDAGNVKSMDPIDRVSSRPDFAVQCYQLISRVYTSIVAGEPSRKGCASGIAAKPIERDTGHEGDATNILVEHQHRHRGATRKQRGVLHGVEQGGGAGGIAYFSDAPHGVGLYLQDPSVGEWGTLLRNWLKERGVLK